MSQSDLVIHMQLVGCSVDQRRISDLERGKGVLRADELLILAPILFIDLNCYARRMTRIAV